MKRFILVLTGLCLFAPMVIGCGQEAKIEKKETISSPGGTTTKTTTEKVKTTGDNPP